MSTKTKKKVKPQKLYALAYRTPTGRMYAVYFDYDSIAFHPTVVNVFNKSEGALQTYYRRAIKLSHARSYSECGNDTLLNATYRHGKVYIVRLGSKDCKLKVPELPTRYMDSGISIERVNCAFVP
jgi:hypothetical protein